MVPNNLPLWSIYSSLDEVMITETIHEVIQKTTDNFEVTHTKPLVLYEPQYP